MSAEADARFMGAALAMARRGLGRCWPNPAVGCVIVHRDLVLGRGVTAPGGRPHAEPQALAQAGSAARGATAYVTLEPCAHIGQTPPCAQALIDAGISRVVIGCLDDDPRVAGKGVALLQGAGIAVSVGVRAEECRAQVAGFLQRVNSGRPQVTLKLATSLDGRIATASGESHWLTGPMARARVHQLRAEHDAVVVGAGTARADDPLLDVRLPGAWPQPRPVVVGRSLPHGLRLAGRDALLVGASVAPPGITPLPVPLSDGQPDPTAVLTALGGLGLTRVLVEGGGQLAAAWVRAGVIDQIAWFIAPLMLGAEGRPALGDLGLQHLAAAPRFRTMGQERLGEDQLIWLSAV